MTVEAIIMMIVVLGGFWGGFIAMLVVAIRQERRSVGDTDVK